MATPRPRPKAKRGSAPKKRKSKRRSIEATREAKFAKFLVKNAEYSLLGHWVIPHSKFVLYHVGDQVCSQVWFVYHWLRDEPTDYRCTSQGDEHAVIRAFFAHAH